MFRQSLTQQVTRTEKLTFRLFSFLSQPRLLLPRGLCKKMFATAKSGRIRRAKTFILQRTAFLSKKPLTGH